MDKDKLEAQKQWNATPCGTGDYLSGLTYGSLEYFEAIRRSRYEITDTWIAHFKRSHIPVVGRLLPAFFERVLEPVLGWYVIAFATK